MYKWKKEDDIVTLYLYLYDNIPYSYIEIANKLGMGVNSLKARIANFKAIEGKGGFCNYAKLSLEVYKQYHEIPEPALRNMVMEILQ